MLKMQFSSYNCNMDVTIFRCGQVGISIRIPVFPGSFARCIFFIVKADIVQDCFYISITELEQARRRLLEISE